MRHRDVGGLGGVGERAHADEVHARLGIGADVFEHDAAGGFGGNPALGLPAVSVLDALHRPADLGGRHVVEQDGFGAMSERLFKLLRGAHFHLHALAQAGASQGRA